MDFAIQQASTMTWQVNPQQPPPPPQNPYFQNNNNNQFLAPPAPLSAAFPEPQKLDLTRPLADQRPVLKRSRLRRDFTPNRDRIDYSHISDHKERRRLRSQDNARLYRDREKQKILDLENSIEGLMQDNSRLTIQNTTLKYKFEVLRSHVEKQKEDRRLNLASKRQAFEDSTQIRDNGNDTICSSYCNSTVDNFKNFASDRIGINDNSEICAVLNAEEKNNKSSLRLEDSSEEKEEVQLNSSKKRNHKNLTLSINDSNKTASSGTSQQTVINLQQEHSVESVVYSPKTVHGSFDSNLKLPLSGYVSAEPSPADEILQKPINSINNNFGYNMQQVKNNNNNQHFTF